MTAYKQSIVNIAQICSEKNIRDIIISPGSRSAPLTLAFLRHPDFMCRTIVDERSAAFLALGLAQQRERPVGLVCTSGTAALNYIPAIAEAHYQQVPLLIFTADRPPEWLDQNDGQTIQQREMYGRYCRGYFELPVDDTHPDAKWHLARLISEAINRSQHPTAGPVHVNVPLREPLYPKTELNYQRDIKYLEGMSSQATLTVNDWQTLLASWLQAQKVLVVAGMHQPEAKLAECLREIQQNNKVTLLCDVTSNLSAAHKVHHYDMILGSADESVLRKLKPDLVLTFGGPVISKNLKLFLRKSKPMHWHVQASGASIDTFQSLVRAVPVSPKYFFENLLAFLSEKQSGNALSGSGYISSWLDWQAKVQSRLEEFLDRAPHCELSAMRSVLNRIPANSHLQLGNSSIVRLASFVGFTKSPGVKVNSNRGTSGIDGTLSTAVGAALATSKLTTAILGDLAFFYDRNGLFHQYLPANLRIIIFNNSGGGIFRVLDGSSDLPELEKHFEVAHNLTAQNTAADHGLGYFCCGSIEALEEMLPDFFQMKQSASILEVKFDKQINAKTFLEFKSLMREIK